MFLPGRIRQFKIPASEQGPWILVNGVQDSSPGSVNRVVPKFFELSHLGQSLDLNVLICQRAAVVTPVEAHRPQHLLKGGGPAEAVGAASAGHPQFLLESNENPHVESLEERASGVSCVSAESEGLRCRLRFRISSAALVTPGASAFVSYLCSSVIPAGTLDPAPCGGKEQLQILRPPNPVFTGIRIRHSKRQGRKE